MLNRTFEETSANWERTTCKLIVKIWRKSWQWEQHDWYGCKTGEKIGGTCWGEWKVEDCESQQEAKLSIVEELHQPPLHSGNVIEIRPKKGKGNKDKKEMIWDQLWSND